MPRIIMKQGTVMEGTETKNINMKHKKISDIGIVKDRLYKRVISKEMKKRLNL